MVGVSVRHSGLSPARVHPQRAFGFILTPFCCVAEQTSASKSDLTEKLKSAFPEFAVDFMPVVCRVRTSSARCSGVSDQCL